LLHFSTTEKFYITSDNGSNMNKKYFEWSQGDFNFDLTWKSKFFSHSELKPAGINSRFKL